MVLWSNLGVGNLIMNRFHRPNLTFDPTKAFSHCYCQFFVVFNLTFWNFFCRAYILDLAPRRTKFHSVRLGISTTRETVINRFRKRLFKFH